MKQLILALVTLSIAAFTPGNTRECKLIEEQAIGPARDVAAFLEKSPTLDNLAEIGCQTLLNTVKNFSAGANTVRSLGARGVENTKSRCTASVTSIHYPCAEGELGEQRCLPEIYTYCGEWAYSLTNQPKYQLAMELSVAIDAAYDKAQSLCGSAMSWDKAATEAATQDLLSYLNNRIIPEGETLQALTCQDGEPNRSPSTRPSAQAD